MYTNIKETQHMKRLKGYQNTSEHLRGDGITVTTQGSSYNIFKLRQHDVRIEKIARSLARERRFNGDTHRPYSVAQHTVRGAEAFLLMGEPKKAIQFMLHDASEAFMKDISRPLKLALSKYIDVEVEITKKIFEYHKVDYPWGEDIEMMDKNLAQDEMVSLMHRDFGEDCWRDEEAEEKYLIAWRKINHYLDNYYKDEGIVNMQENIEKAQQ